MRRDDLCDILKKIPSTDMSKVVFVMRYNAAITLDAVARLEEDYAVVRGREAGTNDEGRAFFVPYEDVLFVRLDRLTTVAELKRLYGEKVADDGPDPLATVLSRPTPANGEDKPVAAAAAPTPAAPALDPAGIAKQNLLARIRAVRSGVNPVSTS